MRGVALAVTVAAVVTAAPAARAQGPSLLGGRGPLSVTGVSLLGLGLASLGLGLAGLASSLDADAMLQPYLHGGVPLEADAPAAAALSARAAQQRVLAIAGLSAAGALLAAGIVCLLVDAPRGGPPLALGLVPLPGGGWAGATWRW